METILSRFSSLLIVFFGLVFLNIQNAQSQCPSEVEWTLNPAPVNGTYAPGQTVEVCGEISDYNIGTAFLGVIIQFPELWELSSAEITEMPEACSSDEGEWLYLEDVTLPWILTSGSGFFFEHFLGGESGDGDPFNDWGDICTDPGATWSFCMTVSIADDCGGEDDPLDGTVLTPQLTLVSDGAISSGPWIPECSFQYYTYPSEIILDCCEGFSGGSPGFVTACQSSISLFDVLIPPFDLGGTWTGPPSWTAGADPTFDPSTDPTGTYAYHVIGTDGCTSSTSFEIGFEDSGIVQYVLYCQIAPVSLFSWLPNPTQTPGGEWTDPDGNIVPSGMVSEDDFPSGVYTYSYENQEGCPASLSIDLTFNGDWGPSAVATTIDVCPNSPPFFLLDSLTVSEGFESVFPNGQWIHEYAGPPVSFVDFYPNSQVLIDPMNLEDNSIFTYAMGVEPCTPHFVPLYVNVYFPPNTGQNTEATVCVNNDPFTLDTLLQGNPDLGLTWTNLSGDVVSNPFDPSDYEPGTLLLLTYSGSENVLGCSSVSFLSLSIIDADYSAGTYTEVFLEEGAQPFLMIDSMGGNPEPGGIWTNADGQEVPLGLFIPGVTSYGLYTYTIDFGCGSTSENMLIDEASGFSAGSEWSFGAPPAGGSYKSGDEVSLDLAIDLDVPEGWLIHGIVLDFPSAWDLSTLELVTPPEVCGISGAWVFMESLVNNGTEYGAGFYFDGAAGTPADGDPTNNIGDLCENIAISFNIVLQDDCEQALGDPYDITPTVVLTPDGLTGSGTNGFLQTIAISPSVELFEMESEEVNAGENGEVFYGPMADSFDLFDSLPGNPDANGMWTDPAGMELPDGIFIPGISADGVYTYFVDGNCSDASAELGVGFDQSLSAAGSLNKPKAFTLYPNPAAERLHLDISSDLFAEGNTEIRIYSVVGQLVLTAPVESRVHLLDVVSFGAGTYLVELYARSTRIGGARFVVSK